MTSQAQFVAASGEDKPAYCSVDISSRSFWSLTSEQREEAFAWLRAEDPVSWQRPVEDAVVPDPTDPGYWAVVKHDDIVRVSRDHETFISGQGVVFDQLPPDTLRMSQSFLAMDPPTHDRLRHLVSSAFTPRQIRRLEAQIRQATAEVVDGFADEPGEVDFVERCAHPLPLRLFADMFGIPGSLREPVGRATSEILGWADPRTRAGRSPAQLNREACVTLHEIATELINLRRELPGDDLFTNLVTAGVDGDRLSDADIRSYFALMSVAATDTTKHTVSFAVIALSRFPSQRDWLRADFDTRIGGAVEEIVRYASPVMTFRRTAVAPTTLRDRTIAPGDKVVMFYPSGNRDEDVFVEPDRLDLSRHPNPHVGFGGGGIHYCLGSHLAKSTMTQLLSQLLGRIPHFHTGEPDLLASNFMRGIKHLPFWGARPDARAQQESPLR